MVMLPVVPIAVPAIAACRQDRIKDLAARYRRDEKAFDNCRHFHPLVRQGQDVGCCLIVSGQDEIALFSRRQPSLLEYRMTALASTGDMLVLNNRHHYVIADMRRYPDFEAMVAAEYPVAIAPDLPNQQA